MKPTIPEPKGEGMWMAVVDWLTKESRGWELFGKWIILGILCIVLILWVLGYLSEKLAKLLESYKNSGLPLGMDRKIKDRIRKRRQFCSVINADLAVLAKTENWNDQYFTDLEAEVEAEGGYYPSALHRLLRRKARGLRRVPSLIEAIESSTEQALLLVGEPGSGKSVALRHLAHQLAQRGSRSADPDAKIPLYINLKEFSASTEEPTADSIRTFLFDNIRRGDADTVAYVRDNWNDFKFRGVWFFLFDSFDEIPAVLHAPAASSVIKEYSEAIRQFLEGLGSCRGVLASREFKGPDTLPWQKLRILPLNESRQDLLIDNSFLEHEQKEVVRRHLAASGSSLGNNPLFLTLLCRYVKEERQPPANDHDLLAGHLERLSARDSDYIGRKYGFTPAVIMESALRLAVLFAVSPRLSLAPSLDEISSSMGQADLVVVDLENVLAALVDVKILRSDVQEAKPGDRRFTFSHRRYQETLFVRYLTGNPSYIPAKSLLSDDRWREYTVTLLQTQEGSVIEPLLAESCQLLKVHESDQFRIEISRVLGGGLAYFNWEGDPAAALVSLLQEGLARRPDLVSGSLSGQIGRFLCARWEHGDMYDRAMVIKLGGLLPQDVLEKYILSAVDSASGRMRAVAFQQAPFVAEMSETLGNWVRVSLSQRLLAAEKRGDLLKLEALSARLPSSLGASFILTRCLLLRQVLRPFSLLFYPLLILSLMLGTFVEGVSISVGDAARKIREAGLQASFVATMLVMNAIGVLVTALIFGRYNLVGKRPDSFMLISMVLVLSLVSSVLFLYAFRAAGQKISLALVVKRLKVVSPRRILGAVELWAMALLAVVAFAAYASDILSMIIMGVLAVVSGSFLIRLKWKSWSARRRFRALRDSGLMGLDLLLSAKSFEELSYWLRGEENEIKITTADIRSMVRLLLEVSESGFWPSLARPLFQGPHSTGSVVHVMSKLEARLAGDGSS